eukprot:c34583_g1_i1.p1 GENE.c34583_g1_i1~~c34583_g1_i1.p1  ORF type:complete len:131 (+),score=48.12 c34583_g1_i1:308-700(+)
MMICIRLDLAIGGGVNINRKSIVCEPIENDIKDWKCLGKKWTGFGAKTRTERNNKQFYRETIGFVTSGGYQYTNGYTTCFALCPINYFFEIIAFTENEITNFSLSPKYLPFVLVRNQSQLHYWPASYSLV